MNLLNQNRLKHGLILALAVIVVFSALPCYADEILSEAVLGRYRFTFIQTGPEQFRPKETLSPESNLYLQVTNTSTGQTIDRYSLVEDFYGNSVYYRPELHALKGKDGTIKVLLLFRYGGDGDHTENRLHAFEFIKNTLTKVGEQNISDPEITLDNGTLDHVKGNYVLTLCDVCDGWEVSPPEDIFFIPIAVSFQNHKLKVANLFTEDEKRMILSRFYRQKGLNIKKSMKYRWGERYKAYTESVAAQIEEILK